MKLKMYFLLLALGALGLQSCNDDDDHLSSVPTELKNAFTEKYPSVSNEKWETKGNYYIAEFRQQNYETSAWFTPNGIWQMTETDIPSPQVVFLIITYREDRWETLSTAPICPEVNNRRKFILPKSSFILEYYGTQNS